MKNLKGKFNEGYKITEQHTCSVGVNGSLKTQIVIGKWTGEYFKGSNVLPQSDNRGQKYAIWLVMDSEGYTWNAESGLYPQFYYGVFSDQYPRTTLKRFGVEAKGSK